MKQTLPNCFPTEISELEERAGFRHMVLALEGFIGPFGDHIEVVGKKLSDSDLLVKCNSVAVSSRDKGGIWYRHIRFGYACAEPSQIDWQHIPFGSYDNPTDDVSRTLAWAGVAGVPFREYEL
jgi:hypothetical protein